MAERLSVIVPIPQQLNVVGVVAGTSVVIVPAILYAVLYYY